jgi:hypothetical protein
MASKSQLVIRKERLMYIKNTWQPTFTYLDVQRYADEFGVRLSTMHQYLKDLGLTYISKQELERLNKIKRCKLYLKDVWTKQPDHERESLSVLSSKFNFETDEIKEFINKLGLSAYLLSIQEKNDAKREIRFKTHEEIYRHYYSIFEKTGEKITILDIAINHKIDYGMVSTEIKKLGLTKMITKPTPTCSYEERVAYYKPRADYFRRFPDLTHTCKKLGLTPNQIYQELTAIGILGKKGSLLDTLDNSIDDGYSDNMLYLDSELSNKGRFTEDEMNKVLGVSAGTYTLDNWG